MKLVVFGLSVSSSWGNGHATLWRGLIHALARHGHSVTFFEWDTPYYSAHRDCFGLPNGRLELYDTWHGVRARAREALRNADVGMVTSYCPHGREAAELVLGSSVAVSCFYDLDTPVTLELASRGEEVPYLAARSLAEFDLVLSYTGGRALEGLCQRFGARAALPLYGSVEPNLHAPAGPSARFRSDLSYLGTYALDRQAGLERLFIAAARRMRMRNFALGGSQYPADVSWPANVSYFSHVPPAEHAAFYCSARLTLNVTRGVMAVMGYCPSGRLFEAAACGAAIISDAWEGLDLFFRPGEEILLASETEHVLQALELSDAELARLGANARERALTEHSVERRAGELMNYLEVSAKKAPRVRERYASTDPNSSEV
jgi:spore maturation protein CgeB